MKTAVIFSAVLLAATGCVRHPELPVYGQVPEFQLISQTGQTFDRRQLDGKIWAADFIYTHCPGPCPRMSSQLQRVQTAVAELPNVRLVSFSVDPAHDTPSVLAEYARRCQALPGRWFFLTGDSKTLDTLDRHAFMLGNLDGSMQHSTRFVLVDRQGRIRGYYGTSEDDPTSHLIADIRWLAKQQS
ncbi:MAG: SCO family protein [Acidobacteria bacterium]|nr:MAG: SCO family protein [Acidobacteriota bacterium]